MKSGAGILFLGDSNFSWHMFLFNLSSCIIKIVLSEEKLTF